MVNHQIFTEEEEENMVVFVIEQFAKNKSITTRQFRELLLEYKSSLPRSSLSKEINLAWVTEFVNRHRQNKKLPEALQHRVKKADKIPMKDNELKKYKAAFLKHLQKLGNKEDTTLKARIEEKRGRKRKQEAQSPEGVITSLPKSSKKKVQIKIKAKNQKTKPPKPSKKLDDSFDNTHINTEESNESDSFSSPYNKSLSTSYNSTSTGKLKLKLAISNEPIKLKIKLKDKNKDIKQEYAIEMPSPSAHIASSLHVTQNENILDKAGVSETKKKKIKKKKKKFKHQEKSTEIENNSASNDANLEKEKQKTVITPLKKHDKSFLIDETSLKKSLEPVFKPASVEEVFITPDKKQRKQAKPAESLSLSVDESSDTSLMSNFSDKTGSFEGETSWNVGDTRKIKNKITRDEITSPPTKKSKLSIIPDESVLNLSLVDVEENLTEVDEGEEGLTALNNEEGFRKLRNFIDSIEHPVISMRKTPNEAQVESKLTKRQSKEYLNNRLNVTNDYKTLKMICLPYEKKIVEYINYLSHHGTKVTNEILHEYITGYVESSVELVYCGMYSKMCCPTLQMIAEYRKTLNACPAEEDPFNYTIKKIAPKLHREVKQFNVHSRKQKNIPLLEAWFRCFDFCVFNDRVTSGGVFYIDVMNYEMSKNVKFKYNEQEFVCNSNDVINVITCFNANGKFIAPMVVFPRKFKIDDKHQGIIGCRSKDEDTNTNLRQYIRKYTSDQNDFIVIVDGDVDLNYTSVTHGFQNNYWFFKMMPDLEGVFTTLDLQLIGKNCQQLKRDCLQTSLRKRQPLPIIDVQQHLHKKVSEIFYSTPQFIQTEFEKSMIWPQTVQPERAKVLSGYEVNWYQPIADKRRNMINIYRKNNKDGNISTKAKLILWKGDIIVRDLKKWHALSLKDRNKLKEINQTEDSPKLLRKEEYEINETVFAKHLDGIKLYRAVVLEKVPSSSKRRGASYKVKFFEDSQIFNVFNDDMRVWPYDKIPELPKNLQNDDNKVPAEIKMSEDFGQKIVVLPKATKTQEIIKSLEKQPKVTGKKAYSQAVIGESKTKTVASNFLKTKREINLTTSSSIESKTLNESSLATDTSTMAASTDTFSTPHKSTPPSLARDPNKTPIVKGKEHCVGDRVWSKWKDIFYHSTVIQCNSDGTYTILFDDNKKYDLVATSITSTKPDKIGVYANINLKKRKENEKILQKSKRYLEELKSGKVAIPNSIKKKKKSTPLPAKSVVEPTRISKRQSERFNKNQNLPSNIQTTKRSASNFEELYISSKSLQNEPPLKVSKKDTLDEINSKQFLLNKNVPQKIKSSLLQLESPAKTTNCDISTDKDLKKNSSSVIVIGSSNASLAENSTSVSIVDVNQMNSSTKNVKVNANISSKCKVCDVDVPAELSKTKPKKFNKKKTIGDAVNAETDSSLNVEKSQSSATNILATNPANDNFLFKSLDPKLRSVVNADNFTNTKDKISEKDTNSFCVKSKQSQEVRDNETDDEVSVSGSALTQGEYDSDDSSDKNDKKIRGFNKPLEELSQQREEENSENSSDEENQIEFITDCCKYDDQESFIQCDRCFSWKHTNCEKIDESSVKMEDQYVCNVCRFPKSVRKSQQFEWSQNYLRTGKIHGIEVEEKQDGVIFNSADEIKICTHITERNYQMKERIEKLLATNYKVNSTEDESLARTYLLVDFILMNRDGHPPAVELFEDAYCPQITEQTGIPKDYLDIGAMEKFIYTVDLEKIKELLFKNPKQAFKHYQLIEIEDPRYQVKENESELKMISRSIILNCKRFYDALFSLEHKRILEFGKKTEEIELKMEKLRRAKKTWSGFNNIKTSQNKEEFLKDYQKIIKNKSKSRRCRLSSSGSSSN